MHVAGPAASATAAGPCADADHATVLPNRSGIKAAGGTYDGFGDTRVSASHLEGISDGADQQTSRGAGHGYLRLWRSDLAALLPHRTGRRMKTDE